MDFKSALRKGAELGVVFSALTALILVGCGGGGGTAASGGGGGSLLAGVAAAGAPVSSGIGYALDAVTGAKISFTTNATTGSFSVDLTGKTGPFLLHVTGMTTGGTQVNVYSLASSASFGKTVNVTPLSDVVVGYAAGQTAASLEAACTGNQAACPALLNGIMANLALANTNIMTSPAMAQALAGFGLTPSTFNAITSSFTATHTGVDGLLDALQVVPPVAAGTTYAINLIGGAGPVTLVTLPVAASGVTPTNGTATAPTAGTALSNIQITQAANLATALSEVKTFFESFNQLMATRMPTSAEMLAIMDANFNMDGMNATNMAAQVVAGNTSIQPGAKLTGGGLADYAGGSWLPAATGPDVNVVYDANNCVTSVWVYLGTHGLIGQTDLFNKTISTSIGCVGTWKWAGNQRLNDNDVVALFDKLQNQNGVTYNIGLHLLTSTAGSAGDTTAATPFSFVTFTGPGLATAGSPTTTSGTVEIIAPPVPGVGAALQLQNSINDPYYGTAVDGTGGSDVLADCATVVPNISPNGNARATANTPCYNSNAVGGSDYVIQYLDAGMAALETVQQRLQATPSALTVPASWYPTITSVTPTTASSIPTGTSNVSWTWTLPAGASVDVAGVNLWDAGNVLLFSTEPAILPTQTSNSVSVSVGAAPASGWVGVLAPIGGLKVGAGKSF